MGLSEREKRVRREAAMTDDQWASYLTRATPEAHGHMGKRSHWTAAQWDAQRARVKALVQVWDGAIEKMPKAGLLKIAAALGVADTKGKKEDLLKAIRAVC